MSISFFVHVPGILNILNQCVSESFLFLISIYYMFSMFIVDEICVSDKFQTDYVTRA